MHKAGKYDTVYSEIDRLGKKFRDWYVREKYLQSIQKPYDAGEHLY